MESLLNTGLYWMQERHGDVGQILVEVVRLVQILIFIILCNMFISFFSKTEYVTGADYSQNPDCIHQENLDMNVDTQEPVLTGSEGNYKIEILDKAIPEETAMQKHARIKQALLSTEDISEFDLE